MIRRGFFSSFVFAVFVYLSATAHRLTAAPASGVIQSFVQPDGSTFYGRLTGDEFFHYYSTTDGHPVVMNGLSRWWYYAEQREEGVGPATDRRAGLDSPPGAAWQPVVPAREVLARASRHYTASVPSRSTRALAGSPVTANVAMLLTSFKDRPNDMEFYPADFEKQFFDTTDPSVFSAREFYRAMSFGLHDVTSGPPLPGTSSGIQNYIQTPQNHDYYGGPATDAGSTIEDGGRIKELARWRAEQADVAGFNFGPYDTNNDGWVDLVCIVYEGRGQADGGSPDEIWPVRSALDGLPASQQPYETNDPNAMGVLVKVKDFIIVPELSRDFKITTIGLFSHEYGHGLGWPDFYDTQRPPDPKLGEASSEGLGRWCLMSNGTYGAAPGGRSGDRPTWANPWCRMASGWVSPLTVTTPLQGYKLNEAKTSNSGTVLRLYPNGVPGPEYFLIENRQWPVTAPGSLAGFDIAMPGAGILIWHVDETKNDNRNEWWNVPGIGTRTTAGNYKVALEQADGLYEMERNVNSGDATDPFTAGTSFTQSSRPSSSLYSGAASNVNVLNISPRAADRSVTADFIIGTDLQPPAVGLTTAVHGGRYYEGVIGSFGGTATDNATVSGVTVVLSRTSPQGYESYNWSAGTWEPGLGTDPPFIAQASLSGSGSSKTWTRSINSAHMPAGSYGLRFQATDSAGLKSTESATWFEIVFDANAPDITFSEPSPLENYMSSPAPNFTGTAVNTTAPITVQAALKMESGDFSGRFLEWSTSNWSAAGVFTAANYYSSTSANWSIPMGARTLPEGRYQLFARVLNGDSRISPWRMQTFRVGQPVQVAVTRPAQDALVASLIDISGSITDPTGSGIAGSAVSLRLTNPLGQSWNGTEFVSSAVILPAPVTGNTWTYAAVPPPSALIAGTYAISVTAAANNGESAPVQIGVNQTIFTVDNLPPAAAILGPAPGSVITSSPLPAFHGTMADPGGIGYVNCYIRRNRDGAFWTGSTWTVELNGAPPQAAPPVAALNASWNDAAGTWTCTSALPQPRLDMENGSYNFIVIAADRAGNYIQTDSAVTLDYHQLFVWTGATLRDASTSNNSNRWETWQNWSPYGVPGPEDYAQISNGDAVVINTDLSVRGIRLSNGTLSASAGVSLTTTGDSTWTGGTIGGVWNNAAGATTVLSGASVKYFNPSTVINNHGLVDWRGGERMVAWNNSGTPVTWNNHAGGILRLSADDTLFSRQFTNVTPVFNNLTGGRIEKNGGSGTLYWYYWTLNNHSDIFLNSGGLVLYSNTTNLHPGSALMGGGTLWLNANAYLRTDLFATAAVRLYGGFLSCTDTMRTWSGPGVLHWTDGTIYGGLTRAAGTVTNIDGENNKVFADESEFINEGTVAWTGTGNLWAPCLNAAGTTVRNRGQWTAGGGADFVRQSANYEANFHNESGGTFTKSHPQTTHSTWRWHNAGTVNINEGWLEWHRNGTHTGTFNIAANSWLHVFAGTHSMADGTPFNGSGNVLINGATVNAAGVLNNNLGGGVELRTGWLSVNPQLRGSGLWKWTGGGISGTASLGEGCTMEVSGTANPKEFDDNTTFDNHGTFIWLGGTSIFARTTSGTPLTFNNHATLRIAADGQIWSRYSANLTAVFNNLPGARIEKTAGTSTNYWYYWTLNNESEIALPSGGLYLNLNRSNFRDGTAFTGTGILYLNTNAYVYAADIQSTVTIDWRGGSLSSVSGSTRTWAGSGPFLWTGGTLYGSLKLAAGVTASLSGPEIKELAVGAELINEGTITWTGTGNITGNSTASPGAVIRNRGTFLADTGSDIVPAGVTVISNFYNETGATFTKTNPGTTYSTWQFHNAGTVNINEGWLEWHRNGTHTGTFNIAANCWLHLFAGTHSMASDTPLNGSGNVLINGATVNAAGVLNNNLGGGVELRNGWISVNPQLRGPGLWKWTGGGISGTASLGTGCTMEVSDRPGAAANKDFYYNTTFDNFGTFIWQGGSPVISNNTSGTALVFNNHSIVRATSDGTLWSRQGNATTTVFNNLPGARFEKSGGTGTLYWYYWTLNNETELAVPTGGLYFYVNRTNLREGSAFTGTGIVYLRTDAYLYASRLHATTDTRFIGVFLSAVGGTRTWAGPGLFSWTDGTLYGSLKLETGVQAALSGAEIKELAVGAELINEGTITWTGTGNITGNSTASPGAVIRNRGTFLADTGSDIVPAGVAVISNFYNEAGATFTKTNPGTTYSTWQFHNAGTVNINEGWLEWHRNGTHTGTFNIAANSWLHVFAGTHSMANDTPFNGAGNVLINGATVNAAGVLNNNLGGGVELRNGWISVNPQLRGSGLWKWTGGGISGTASLGTGCTMEVSDRPGAAANKDFYYNTTFDNYGTFIWQGGSSMFSNNTSGTALVFNNHSIVRATSDGTLWSRQGNATTTVFNNLPGARFEKTGGTGTLYWYYWTLNNETEIAVPTGGLYFYVNRTNLREGSAFNGTGIVYLRTDAYLYASRLHATTDTRLIGVFLSAEGGTRTWGGPGPFSWTEGTLWGSLKFEAGASVTLGGTESKEFAPGAELINEGTVTVSGTGVISGRTQTATVTIRNRPGALWRQDTTASIQWQSAANSGLFENAGTIEIGAGVFYLNGWRFTQTATGAIYSDVTATGHDQIYVYNVPVTAAGTLHLRRAPGFTPPQGTYYDILTGAGRSGTFANVTGGFHADYQPTLARVTAQPPAESYDQWIAAAGFTGPDALRSADPDHDGADNLTEFAFRGNPGMAGDLSWDRTIEEIDGESWITLHYRRWQDREQAGIVYEPGASPALSAWNLSGLVDEPDTAATAISNSTAWRARIRLGGHPRFLRVSVRDTAP